MEVTYSPDVGGVAGVLRLLVGGVIVGPGDTPELPLELPQSAASFNLM